VLEVNPRASRTVPFVSKATGVPLGKGRGATDDREETRVHAAAGGAAQRRGGSCSARILFGEIAGVSLQQVSRRRYHSRPRDALNGRSHGNFDIVRTSVCESQLAAGQRLPRKGTVFLSVNDRDKKHLGVLGKELSSLGFHLLATRELRLHWNPPASRPRRYSK